MGTRMLRKGLAIAVILLFIGMCVVPSTAVQELREKSLPINFDGNTLKEQQIAVEEGSTSQGDEVDWWPISYSHPFHISVLQSEQMEQTTQIKEASHLEDGSTEVVSTESDGDSQTSSLAIDNEGTIHVVWCDTAEYENATDGGLYDIFYKKKPSGGEWTPVEVVTPESSVYRFVAPSMGVDSSGTVHVAWWVKSNPDNYHPICYKMKPKDGNWTTTEIIPTDTVGNQEVYLTVDSEDTVHIVWMALVDESSSEVDIYYNKKPKEDSWSVTEMVSTESTDVCWWPSIAAESDDTIHVVWSDNTNYQVCGSDYDTFYKMKPKEGNWTSTEVVSKKSPLHCGIPYVTVGPDGSVHASWAEMITVNLPATVVFYSMKPTSGSWSSPERITEVSLAYTSRLAVDESGTIHHIWDDTIEETIFYRKKPNGGSWSHTEFVSPEIIIRPDRGVSLVPRFVVADDALHIVWTDSTNYNDCGKDNDIFYKMRPIIDNQPPTKPTINGPRIAQNQDIEFTYSSTDPDGDDVYYYIIQQYFYQIYLGLAGYWSGWLGPNSSGEERTFILDFWQFGICKIKIRAMDSHGAFSDWGTLHVITDMSQNKLYSNPVNQQSTHPWFQWFLERFPNAFPILRQLLEL